MFALVDCNNFYASCERVFRPDLRNKPIVVLSNNDGCVIARSNESKALGIPMGAVAYQYEKFFKENNVQVFSSNYPLYGDMSQRVANILHSYTPDIEVYSIDESFLQFKGFEKHFNLRSHCLSMQKRVLKWTGIPTCVGVAPTKALSKVANRIAKKYPHQTKGVHIIDTEEKRIKALKWLKVEDIWGIGRRYAKKLQSKNIFTAHQFAELHPDWVQKEMSIVGRRLHRDLNGFPTLSLDDPILQKKNIATTRSFNKNITDVEELKERICTFADFGAEKLRKQKSICNAMLVFINTNPHRQDLPQYRRSTLIKLPFPTSSSITLTKYAKIGLQRIYKKGFHYKKAGVILMDIFPEKNYQISLFENENPKHKDLMRAIDFTNKKYSRKKVKLANQDLTRIWKMRQERLSPCYTTNFNDIIIVQ